MSGVPVPSAAEARLPPVLRGRLALPVIASPMFIVSGPDLVIAQCLAGVVGSFPALNARPQPVLDEWLTRITTTLREAQAADPSRKIAPFAVNQIVHASNDRLAQDVEACVRHAVPIIITSLRAPDAVIKPVHAYGGVVFHDVISVRHARRRWRRGSTG